MASTTSRIPLIARAEAAGNGARTAIIDEGGPHSYDDLLDASEQAAGCLLDGQGDLDGARVAYLVPPSLAHVAVQWGIWRAGGVAVPLCILHPPAELAYVIGDSDAEIVVAHPIYAEVLRPIAEQAGRRLVLTTDVLLPCASASLPNVPADRAALLVYTSGTTNRPKGAVITHAILAAQIASLIEAWEWTADDRILLALPLHHVHGILNVVCCALWSGAICEMPSRFDADTFWRRVVEGGLTLFMAVPTIYSRLVKSWDAADPATQAQRTAACARLRLMVCGSAALPVTTLEQWRKISGHTLLERYGMTEIGMGISNPLHGERRPGHIGSPLPGVEVRMVDEHGGGVPDGTPGEIQIRGPNVFREYWRKPAATAAAFVDGWFRTGDIAVREDNIFRILGRESVDIIKTGGFKVSALEIEDRLRTHEAIEQCAVVGAEDPEWGERVCAAVVLRPGTSLDLPTLRDWAKQRLAVYKVPSRLLVLRELPQNAMGKVVKPEVAKAFRAAEPTAGAPQS